MFKMAFKPGDFLGYIAFVSKQDQFFQYALIGEVDLIKSRML